MLLKTNIIKISLPCQKRSYSKIQSDEQHSFDNPDCKVLTFTTKKSIFTAETAPLMIVLSEQGKTEQRFFQFDKHIKIRFIILPIFTVFSKDKNKQQEYQFKERPASSSWQSSVLFCISINAVLRQVGFHASC